VHEGRKKRQEGLRSAATADERRRHKRFADEVKVRYRDLEGIEPAAWGETRDLSLGGLCLVSAGPVELGAHLALEVHIARETAPILALGRVVRVSEEPEEEANAIGVEFLWIGEEDRANLCRLAKYFQQKFGETGELA
jgi:c-di-GMP-binding flagellar brake protein YcgR